MTDLKLPYMKPVKAKGKIYGYYSRAGDRQKIEGDFGSIEFLTNYTRIHEQFETAPKAKGTKPGTFAALVSLYYRSAGFKSLSDRARQDYRAYLDRFIDKHGERSVHALTRRGVLEIRDSLHSKPSTANHMIDTIRMLINFAIDREMMTVNPASGVKKLKTGDGWEAWPQNKIEKARNELTGVCRTAFMLALYTGQRKGDVLDMEWADIAGDQILVTQSKTGKELVIPIHPTLQDELSKAPRKGPAIAARRDGDHLTVSGFNRMWRRRKPDGVQFHGLRRNAVKELLEAGCSTAEVSSITGQTFEMVQHYAQQVDQKRMARAAMDKWIGKPTGKLRIVGESE